MDVASYFKDTGGTGILATADSQGKVDIAVYAHPHVIDETTVAFIMRHRQSYANLTSNPHASYLYMENISGLMGTRLYLTKKSEDDDAELIESMTKRTGQDKNSPVDEARSVVYFA